MRDRKSRARAYLAVSTAFAYLLVATIYSTPSVAASLFTDGFESGDLSAWTSSVNFVVGSTSAHTGLWAGEAGSSGPPSYATAVVGSQTELWSTEWFKIDSRTGGLWLTSFRNKRGGALLLTGLNRKGFVNVRYTTTKTTYTSAVKLTDTDWHQISMHLKTGSGGGFDVALDGVPIGPLSASSDAGRKPIAQVMVGDTYTTHHYDVTFDDISVGTEGPSDTTDPTQPTGLAATLESELSVSLSWEPSSDDTRVTGYTILRSVDGTNYSEVGSSTTTSFTDSQLQPETTYWWTIEASDAAGNRSVPSDPATATTGTDPAPSIGRWSEPFDLGVVGMHAALLNTGKVLLYWGADASEGSTAAKLWDPTTGAVEDVRVPDGFDHNLFCSSLALRSDGGVFVTGGTLWGVSDGTPDGTDQTAFFDPTTEQWRIGPAMALRRWYDTTVELPDGDALVFSGQVVPGEQAPQVEHYDGDTDTIWTLPSSATLTMQNYPRMFLMRDGRIARVGREAQTMFFDPDTNEWSTGPTMNAGERARGSAVLLPDGHTVLAVGGAINDVTTNTAEVVDLAASHPSWSYTASMHEPRRSLNAVLLPDGKVLAIGGNRGTHNYDDPVFSTEIYDPATGTWRLGPSQTAPRAYHSTAVLLPDGRVLSAGQTDGPLQTSAEIYSPPYLFAGPRPIITGAPSDMVYSGAFSVDTDRAADIANVLLIRPAAVTHGVAFDQRSVPLHFTAQSATTLAVDAPTSVQAPPGWYMMFLVDNTGVPSIASWIHVS